MKFQNRYRKLSSFLIGGAISLWAVFTIALIIWWYIFSQQQMERLAFSGASIADELIRNQKMLLWEGATLIFSLLLGAGALIYFVARDRAHSQQIMEFFLTFTHEIKTPIASVRLYAESLAAKLGQDPLGETSELCRELLTEVDRLSLQLENSLTLTNIHAPKLLPENIPTESLFSLMQDEFSQLNIEVEGQAMLFVDNQAMRIVLRNILKNSVVHGKADRVGIVVTTIRPNRVRISILDNGRGLSQVNILRASSNSNKSAHPERLGRRFQRLYSGSGTGIGLYLCRRLVEEMHGRITFPASSEGFLVELELPTGTDKEQPHENSPLG